MNNLANLQAQRNQFQLFPFHMVTASPWPMFISFSLLILTMGSVVYIQGYASPFGDSGISLVLLGFISTALCLALWLRDVVTEGTFLGDHTIPVQKGLSLGMVFFIITEVFFFISIFWALFLSLIHI